ncbi:hypothetical protein GW17_00033902 [Ensete ventricosum]|nr:hypothetical protein GW17_00033902 [Ensete ventricosum]
MRTARYRVVSPEPEFLPVSRLVSPRRAIHHPQAISSPRVGRTNEVTGFDDEMRAVVAKNLEGRGIRLHPGTNLSELSRRQEKTVMKLVVDSETDKVLGASMCGPDAPEIMQGLAVALKCGATKAQFDGTVGIHPSAAEEFVTMRSITRRVAAGAKPKANI